MNDNTSQLSLGNLFNIIKKEAVSRNAVLQSELFCILFELKDISDTTVNNYCTGYRAINSIYKEKYLSLQKRYKKNITIFKNIILSLLSILDGYVYINNEYTFEEFLQLANKHKRLKSVCIELYNISKNDNSVGPNFSKDLYINLQSNKLYEFIIQVLFFIILEKKQPIYMEDEVLSTIQTAVYNTTISSNEISEFLNMKLIEGALGIRGIRELAKKGNPYACMEIGNLEFYGQISGFPRYVESYHYYKIASDKNHPSATWFIGFMYYNGFIGNRSQEDYKSAWNYFVKSEKLNCIAALNSIGLAYLEGKVPGIKEKDEKKAVEYFKKAADKNYVYAFNNLGSIYEKRKEYEKAFHLYLKSANLGQSWAANKIGDFYRLGQGTSKNEKKAFKYYNISVNSSIFEICPWSKFNLAYYFYKNGNVHANVEKNLDLAIKFFEEASKDNKDIKIKIEQLNIL